MAIMSKLSTLKPGTRKLMDVLKRIKNVQTSDFKRNISLSDQRFGQPLSKTGPLPVKATSGLRRQRLAESHKQVRKIGKSKGYRDYLKRMT